MCIRDSAHSGRYQSSVKNPLGDEASKLAQQGDIAGAVAKFQEALTFDPSLTVNPDAAQYWNGLCWHGTIWNQAALVMDACDTAVSLAPDNGAIRASRGLARGLTGDVQGAIEDFEFALAQQGRSDDFIAKRIAWVEALRAGTDPALIFDEATLADLRNE